MNNYYLLTKILFKNTFNPISSKSKLKTLLFVLIIFLAFLPLIVMMSSFIAKMFDGLLQIGQTGIILGLGFAVVSLCIFFFGLFYIIGIFYLSSDIEYLLPLPLKPYQIIGAKFTVALVYEYLTEIFFLLPILITFGIKGNYGIMYYLYGIIVFLTLPVIPLIIASIIDMIVMRFTTFFRNKDRFKVIAGVVTVFAALALNGYMQKFAGNMTSQEDLIKMMTSQNNSFLDLATKTFPTAKFQAESLIYSTNVDGFINLLIFLTVTVLFILIFLFIGTMLYFSGVIGMSESYSKRKKLSLKELNSETSKRSKLLSYTIKEFKLLFRSPISFMNCILPLFLWPIIAILPMFTQSTTDLDIAKLQALINNPFAQGIILAGALSIGMFITATNAITSTAISREGKNMFVNKYIPISYREQILSKTFSGAIIGIIGSIIMLGCIQFYFKMTVLIFILALILAFMGTFITSFTGIIFDLYFPKLVWDNEQKAVKQNTNVVFNMLLSITASAITIFAVVWLKLTLANTFLVIFLIFGLINILLYRYITGKGAKIFDSIEA